VRCSSTPSCELLDTGSAELPLQTEDPIGRYDLPTQEESLVTGQEALLGPKKQLSLVGGSPTRCQPGDQLPQITAGQRAAGDDAGVTNPQLPASRTNAGPPATERPTATHLWQKLFPGKDLDAMVPQLHALGVDTEALRQLVQSKIVGTVTAEVVTDLPPWDECECPGHGIDAEDAGSQAWEGDSEHSSVEVVGNESAADQLQAALLELQDDVGNEEGQDEDEHPSPPLVFSPDAPPPLTGPDLWHLLDDFRMRGGRAGGLDDEDPLDETDQPDGPQGPDVLDGLCGPLWKVGDTESAVKTVQVARNIARSLPSADTHRQAGLVCRRYSSSQNSRTDTRASSR